MILDRVIELAHWQFALSSSLQDLFLPLTLGLSLIVAIMESAYLITHHEIYKEMACFWGKFLGINFAIDLLIKLALACQFGINWSYYTYYMSDISSTLIMIESLIALLNASLISLFYFTWNTLSKKQHLLITWLMTLSAMFSVVGLLIVDNGLQNLTSSQFNYQTMRMEIAQFPDLIFNPEVGMKCLQTLTTSYILTITLVLSISAYYLLKQRHLEFAQRSFTFAAGFGLVVTLAVITLAGVEHYSDNKRLKTNKHLFSLLNTALIDKSVIARSEMLETNRQKIRKGIKAHVLLDKLRDSHHQPQLLVEFEHYKKYLGYGLLLKRYLENIEEADDEQIEAATHFSMTSKTPVLWSFNIMLGFYFISLTVFIIIAISYLTNQQHKSWLLKLSLYSFPLPWLAFGMDRFIIQLVQQPWAVTEVLPIFLSPSSLSETHLGLSLIAYIITFSVFISAEIFLMLKLIKQGIMSLDVNYHTVKINWEKN